jgi:hypothetical protein
VLNRHKLKTGIGFAATLVLSLPLVDGVRKGRAPNMWEGSPDSPPVTYHTDPGAYLANYLYYYDGKTASVAVNGKAALNVSTGVYFEIPQVTYITKLTFLGGNYGFGIAVPVGYVSVDVGINPAGISDQ